MASEAAELHLETARPAAESRAWLRACIVAAACYYPLWLAAQFLIHALPALLLAALPGHRIEHLEFSYVSIVAWSAAPGSALDRAAGPWAGSIVWVRLGACAAAAAVLSRLAARVPSLCGLAMALLGISGFASSLAVLLRLRVFHAGAVVGLVLFGAILWIGVRRILPQSDASFWRRAALLLGSVSAPQMLLLGAVALWVSRRYTQLYFWLLVLPGVVACLAAAAQHFREAPGASRQPSWRLAGYGMLATVLLMLGLPAANRAIGGQLRTARLAESRARVASLPPIPAGAPYPKRFFQKGVNFTAEFPAVYESPRAHDMLEGLPDWGVNAIALVPYGRLLRNPPGVGLMNSSGWETDEGILQLSRIAHHRGIKVLLKPQLWRSPHDLEIRDPAARSAWFAQYSAFVEHYARLARDIHADLFCIGVEFQKMTRHEREWRDIIARVRAIYPGPLVYAANFGPEFESLAFWDALDYIGLDNYYPLPDDLSTGDIVAKVHAVQARFDRPVIFTEAGFPSVESPHRRPWEDPPGRVSLEEQARCYEAVFQAFYRQPWFHGVYWWKVGTDGRGGENDATHTPWRKPAMDVVKRWYLNVPRPD